MITGELKNKVDSIWDTIWTGGIANPITVLEQITYLLFMKLLDDNQLKQEANAALLGVELKKKVFKDGVCVISENPRVETDYRNLRWSVFHNFEPNAMFRNIQAYVFPFIKQIGEGKDTAFKARAWIVDIHDQSEDRPDIEGPYTEFDIRTYREKVIDYLAEHSNSEAIRKIKNIEPITNNDLDELQRVLWEELGTKEDYYKATDNDNVAAFVRSLVGLDQDTVNKRFGEYLDGNNYNSRQQEFIKAIINYVRENGDISKEDLLETEPFENYDLTSLFGERVIAVLDVVNTLHNSIRLVA